MKKHQEEHQLEDHRRRNGHIAVAAVFALDLLVGKVEVDESIDLAQRMIGSNPQFKIDVGVEKVYLGTVPEFPSWWRPPDGGYCKLTDRKLIGFGQQSVKI